MSGNHDPTPGGAHVSALPAQRLHPWLHTELLDGRLVVEAGSALDEEVAVVHVPQADVTDAVTVEVTGEGLIVRTPDPGGRSLKWMDPSGQNPLPRLMVRLVEGTIVGGVLGHGDRTTRG